MECSVAGCDQDVNCWPVIRLDERLMKAADALLAHGEFIDVIYAGPGRRRSCRLLNRGSAEGTVDLYIWCGSGKRISDYPIRYEHIELPLMTAGRLEEVAIEQELTAAGRETRTLWDRKAATPERQRALDFIAQARIRRMRGSGRDALGRYQDSVHRCEPAARR